MRFEELGGRTFSAASGGAGHHQHPQWPSPGTAAGLPGLGGGGVAASLVDLSLSIVRESRGPMRLWDFAHRLRRRLGMPPVPTSDLCDAVKHALEAATAADPRLTVQATSMPGVGYVYDPADLDNRPVRSSR